MKTVRHRDRKSNLLDTAKPKSKSWQAHVMSHYDMLKLAPNLQPSFYHYTKYLKCPFQRLTIIITPDSIYNLCTVCKALC